MPAAPTITAALRAAALANMDTAERHFVATYGDIVDVPGRGATNRAAAAIAAFLRGMPDWYEVNGRCVSAAYMETLAAAVEEAARDV